MMFKDFFLKARKLTKNDMRQNDGNKKKKKNIHYRLFKDYNMTNYVYI